MPLDRKSRTPTTAVPQRPAAAFRAPVPAVAVASPASVLQQRLGTQATLSLLSRMSAPQSNVAGAATRAPASAAVTAVSPIPEANAALPPKLSPKVAKPEQGTPTTAGKPPPADAKAAENAETKAPSAREAIAPAVNAVRNRATRARKPGSPTGLVGSAQRAAKIPGVEQTRGAAIETVATLNSATPDDVARVEFKKKLKEAIDASTQEPKTESQASEVMKTGAKKANEALRGELATKRDAAAGPMITAVAHEALPGKQPVLIETKVQGEPVGPPPAPVSASSIAPAPLPAERLDYSSDRAPTDSAMVEGNVTKEQLEQGNDPAFGPTLKARGTAETHEAAAAAKYRQGEGKVQSQAKAVAGGVLAKDLTGVHGVREGQIGKVLTKQNATKDKDAHERQVVTNRIAGIKNKTRSDVDVILKAMETGAVEIFERGLKRAETAYAKTFDDAKGGTWTWLTTWGDSWEKLIKNSLGKARTEYFRQVDLAIDEVANFVEAKLREAKKRVADGKIEVDDFVRGLDGKVKQFGEDAAKAVSDDFDAMVTDIDGRRDALINKLSDQYKASYKRMNEMEERLREANKSLWQRVYDATVGLIKKIIAFKDMLLSVLAKAASVVLDILAHPIRFLGNLVSGVMQGLEGFISKLDVYLVKGIMEWLFGALSGAGLELPDKFDLKGIISIVLQILGLTYANFRARAVTIVGEPVVAAIEKTAEVFKIIATEGIGGLVRFVQDQLGNLKAMVLDAIFDFIKERVISAGIKWIVGLLNPVSAFFKACKAIFDIVMFFIKRGKQIIELVNAVIDSVAAIAAGNVGAAAAKVEAALAKAIPVAIGFLASLLGIGDPSKPVKEFIEKARVPVNKAIDGVINLAAKGVKGLVGLAKTGVKRLYNWWVKKVPVNVGGKKHTLMFDGADKNATLVLRSDPEKPSKFLDAQGAKGGIPAAQRDKPVDKAVGYENAVGDLLSSLKKVDDNTADAASGKAADKADALSKQLDGKMVVLGAHISTTFDKWGVSDETIEGLELPRERFTRDHKRGIAAQHKDTSELRKDSQDEMINLKKGLARRHVVSSHDISSHYEKVLNKKKISEGKLLLEQRGSIAAARTPVASPTKEGIKVAARTRYLNFFGYLRNLFIGDSRENSSIQEHLDAGHPDLAGKKLEEHVRHVKRAWALEEKVDISRLDD